MNEKLTRALERDQLTDIYNRKYFMERIAQLPETVTASVLMIDIDHFKVVNDTHGHFVGDTVIRYVATKLAEACRETDFVARFGGEEFVIFLRDADEKSAGDFAERVRTAIAHEPVKTSAGPISVTVSIGLGYKGAGTNFEVAMTHADAAMYASKRSGRNRTSLVA